MALPFAQMSADLAHIHSDVPHTFTFDGTDYVGSLGTTEIDIVYSEMGESGGVDVILIATVSDFTTAPAEGDLITYEGKEYRVMFTRLDTAKVGISLHLGDKYKKATR